MPDQTVTFPTGQQIYDAIMAGIEPELVSSVVPTLKEKYKNETLEQAKLRSERYRKAYAQYDQKYGQFAAEIAGTMREMQLQAIASAEKQDRAKEAAELKALEQQFTSVSPA